MTATSSILPSYQRFVNGVPVPLFSRRSFRPREKYLILLVFLTFGVVCFGTFFFLPDFRAGTGGVAVNSVYRVYQHMQKAGPELLIPAPPRLQGGPKGSMGHPNAVPPGHEGIDHQDVHLIEDKQKLQVRASVVLRSLDVALLSTLDTSTLDFSSRSKTRSKPAPVFSSPFKRYVNSLALTLIRRVRYQRRVLLVGRSFSCNTLFV